jgi:hypothetical protein
MADETQWRLASSGLKARVILAWGNAPGAHQPNNCGLKARAKTPRPQRNLATASATNTPPNPHNRPRAKRLIPHKPLIELHPILREHRPHLGLEIAPLMVRGLRIDIPHQRRSIAQPNRKRRIPLLPTELRKLGPLGLDPLGRRHLEPLYYLRDRFRTRNKQRNVNVVRNSANPHANILGPAEDRSQIRMHLAPDRIVQERTPLPRTEYQVYQHIGERLRHGSEYSAGLQPAMVFVTRTWGVAPGYDNAGLQPVRRLEPTGSTLLQLTTNN